MGSDGGFNWIYEVGGEAVLHNLDNTIRGGNLNIGYNNLEVINDALIVSDAGHTISINPPAQGDGFINNGTIRADGGTIHLDADHFDNGGGVIEALNGSVVELDNCWIHGGTIRSDDTGEVQCRSVPRLALDQTPTIEGTLRINNGRELRSFGAGTINNTGTILMDSTGSNTYFRLEPEVNGDVVQLTGGGEIVASDGGFNWIYEVGGEAVLHNLDNTIRGGRLKLGFNNLPVVNFGTILGDSDAHPLFVDPPTDAPGFDNQGLLQATGAAGVDIESGVFTTSGTVDIALGSVISRSGDWTQTGGSTNVDGNLTVTGGVVDLQGGTLAGNGSVNGNVNNVSGSVAPGSSAGTLTIIGDYVQGTNGTLAIELGGTVPGTQHDVLAIDGDAQLAGSLTLTPIDGYEPLLGDEFTILTTTGVVIDQFEFVDCGALYQVSYEDSAVVVSVIGEAVEGDLNCDGCVNQSDLGILLGGYGTSDAGDLDGDGDTDQSDLGILLGAYGNGC